MSILSVRPLASCMAGFLFRKNLGGSFIPQPGLPGQPESACAFSAFARGPFLVSSGPMKRRFEDKGPNFLFIGAAVLVLFGMIWLSCHQREFIDAFTDEPAPSAPADAPPAN